MPWEIADDYLIGDEYDVNDEIDALLSGEVGATRIAARRSSAALARRPQMRPMTPATSPFTQPSGAMIREVQPTKARLYPLGFDSVVAIAAAATTNVQAQPQVVFRPDRLIVPQAVAPNFILNSLTVGKDNMFAAAGAIPCEAFSNVSNEVLLKLATAQVSSIIVMNVTNVSAAGQRFMAVLIGPAIE